MADKKVFLNNKAFNLLKNARKEHETFSDAIIRILSKQLANDNFLSLAGSLKGEITEEELEDFIKVAKQAWN